MSGNYNDKTKKEVIQYPNGDVYEGELVQAQQRAQSMSSNHNMPRDGRSDYDDAMRVGMREGHGCFIAKDRQDPRNYEYRGLWQENRRDGQGRCYFYNGDLYEGEWVRGKRHGKGKAFLQSGERYVGLWEADRRHG